MDYEQFIDVFQKCNSNAEVAEKLNISEGRVSSLASKLRKRGIPLKYRRHNLLKPEKIEQLRQVAQG